MAPAEGAGAPRPLRGARAWRAWAWVQRAFAPTRQGAVRLALALHLVVFAGATALGIDYRGWESLIGVWHRWDTTHYLRIAAEGYDATPDTGGPLLSAFLPVFPLLVRGLSVATGSPLLAALLLALAGSLLASAVLFEIVASDAHPREARRAVAWLGLYPTSLYLVAGYTEAVFLALVLAAFLYARRDDFVRASLAAAVAGATRIAGVAVLPALALEAWLVSRERGDGRLLRRLAAVVLIAPLGLGAYLATNFAVYGDPLEFLRHQREQWDHVPSTPWRELTVAIVAMMERPFTLQRILLADSAAVTVSVLLATVVFAAARLRASYAVYAASATWFATAVTWNISVPRYALAVWPLFWGLAVLGRGRWRGAVLGGVSAAALAFLAQRFMSDRWAF